MQREIILLFVSLNVLAMRSIEKKCNVTHKSIINLTIKINSSKLLVIKTLTDESLL